MTGMAATSNLNRVNCSKPRIPPDSWFVQLAVIQLHKHRDCGKQPTGLPQSRLISSQNRSLVQRLIYDLYALRDSVPCR